MFLSWQDLVLGLGGFVFAPSLVPMIIRRVRTPLATSIPTSITLYAFAITFGSLGLWLGTISTVLTAVGWSIIALRGRNVPR